MKATGLKNKHNKKDGSNYLWLKGGGRSKGRREAKRRSQKKKKEERWEKTKKQEKYIEELIKKIWRNERKGKRRKIKDEKKGKEDRGVKEGRGQWETENPFKILEILEDNKKVIRWRKIGNQSKLK